MHGINLFSEQFTVLSWLNWASRFNTDGSVMIETRTMFSPLEDEYSQSSSRNTINETQRPSRCNTAPEDSRPEPRETEMSSPATL
ncbi:hypothetical protein CKAH01_17042 [Colletotrichum kahawae]|uniref:Uncharacterized protein n=1 Tax=Colletotrichum kahawae TaxID=34407 RepID=A0AAD9YC78_COLKA|nr:hypothetical protein CKAH01_17042 [Colletotrichum kahawae]